MQCSNFSEVLDLIRQEDARFERNAYYFVRQALDYTLKEHAGNPERTSRHVSGQELLEGIRVYALDQYGPMTLTVLHSWNIRECGDFGEIVFQLVEYGVLGKTEQDSKEDFDSVYDFEEAFSYPYLPEKKRRALQSKRARETKRKNIDAN